jgi:hypothetical protein
MFLNSMFGVSWSLCFVPTPCPSGPSGFHTCRSGGGDNRRILQSSLGVTSRQVAWLFLEQLGLEFVPFFYRLQERLAAQG